MVRITARRRQPKTQDQQTGMENAIFDSLAAHAESLNTPEPAPAAEPKDKNPEVEALLKQIEALSGRVDAAEKANMALISSTPQAPQAPKRPDAVSMANLPDPVTQGELYATELQKRIEKHTLDMIEYNNLVNTQAASASQSENKKWSTLWEDFNIEYSDYNQSPEDQDRIEFAASKVIQEAKKRGIDPDRYVFQHRDQFFADLAAEYDKIWPVGDTVTLDQGSQPRNPNAIRTAGVFAGADSGSRPSPGRQAPQSDLISELKAEQKRIGIV